MPVTLFTALRNHLLEFPSTAFTYNKEKGKPEPAETPEERNHRRMLEHAERYKNRRDAR